MEGNHAHSMYLVCTPLHCDLAFESISLESSGHLFLLNTVI